jgi:CRP-like cAMP-binding protein
MALAKPTLGYNTGLDERPMAWPIPTTGTTQLSQSSLRATRRVDSLINRLSETEAARLLGMAAWVPLAPRQVLSHGEVPMESLYIVETGLVSVMAQAERRRWVEVWMAGPGDWVGLPPLLGDGYSIHRSIVQVRGTALRLPATEFRALLDESMGVRALALEHLRLLLLHAAQTGACNAQHSAIERITRWLLLASHKLGELRLPISHESLARAIGLRRATVSDCVKQLEARHAVKSRRRLIEIDPVALQSCSCACYRAIIRSGHRPRSP